MTNLIQAFQVRPDASGRLPPKEVVNFRIIALAIFGAFAASLFGYDLGFIGGVVTLPAFLKDFDLNNLPAAQQTAFASNVVSVFQAGAVAGALISSPIGNMLGRRWCLALNLGIYLIGAIFMTAASGSAGVGLMYTGRVLTGWGVGASTMLVPVYVAECSPAHIRGRLVGLYEVGVQFGTMVGFWIPYGVLKTQKGTIQWRLPCAIQIIPAAICMIGLLFLDETPRFVAKKFGEAKARATLSKLRNLPEDHDFLQAELNGIMEQVHLENAKIDSLDHLAGLKRTFGRDNIRRLYTGALIMLFFQMAGTNAVNYYSPRIFQGFGFSTDSSKLFATGIYGVVRFVSTLIAMVIFTDRFGRRSMIVVGGSIMAICMWTIGALTHVSPPHAASAGPNSYQLGAVILIYIWAVAFCFSYAGIPWIYCSEIFPLDIRVFCMAICTSVHWLFNLMLAKTTPYMIENLTPGGIYFVFAACTTVGAIWQFFCMPETRGRTLEQIEEAFGGKARSETLEGSEEKPAAAEYIEKV